MGRTKKEFYSSDVVNYKQLYYKNLPEKERRHFLGQEYLHLGIGSQRYLARVFGCSRDTIIKGAKEVSSPDFNPDYSRQRLKGGGRKKKSKSLKI